MRLFRKSPQFKDLKPGLVFYCVESYSFRDKIKVGRLIKYQAVDYPRINRNIGSFFIEVRNGDGQYTYPISLRDHNITPNTYNKYRCFFKEKHAIAYKKALTKRYYPNEG